VGAGAEALRLHWSVALRPLEHNRIPRCLSMLRSAPPPRGIYHSGAVVARWGPHRHQVVRLLLLSADHNLLHERAIGAVQDLCLPEGASSLLPRPLLREFGTTLVQLAVPLLLVVAVQVPEPAQQLQIRPPRIPQRGGSILHPPPGAAAPWARHQLETGVLLMLSSKSGPCVIIRLP